MVDRVMVGDVERLKWDEEIKDLDVGIWWRGGTE